MSEFDQKREKELERDKDVFSKVFKTGKRTYFFDVRRMLAGELYLVLTESIKKQDKGGNITYNKHKIHIYKEDMDNFIQNMNEAVGFIKDNNGEL